ncbi:hypothetical protein [Acinetobacter ursingii]|uniref:hypothetical protein n=1 Tax=Acinetobacter ursingii TaxID=108980 RepID=UPI00124CBE44|nr:hypothetical protein [Acinetobacter ursingii]
MIDLATKQAFWCEQLPNFEAKYWLPSHFEFLIFDKDQGNYVIKEDLDPSFEDEATEIFHRVNTGWAMWKKAINFNDQQAEIDSLKAENAALKEKLGNMEDCWYWDGAEYYVTDPYQYDLNDLDNFEIITLEKYQTTPRVPEYFCKVFEDEDTCEIIAFPDYADAKKAIANNKRIFNEAQGDGDE